MTALRETEHRHATIDLLRDWGTRLSGEATHATLQEQVTLAMRDLNEAELRLGQPEVDTQPYTLAIVDSLVELATARLDGVNNALQTHGRDATLIG